MSGERETDQHTGTETTGHEWDGIKELDTPLPRWWLWIFYACIAFAVVYWVLMPSWPLINGYTPGILHNSTRAQLGQDLNALKAQRAAQASRLSNASLEQIEKDPALLAYAPAAAAARAIPTCATTSGCGAARWRTSSAPSPTACGRTIPRPASRRCRLSGATRCCSRPRSPT